ncbi:hypothetical protein PENTCL1PPCAC_8397, partial [Pristionchus entomophagus]
LHPITGHLHPCRHCCHSCCGRSRSFRRVHVRRRIHPIRQGHCRDHSTRRVARQDHLHRVRRRGGIQAQGRLMTYFSQTVARKRVTTTGLIFDLSMTGHNILLFSLFLCK